MKKDIILSLIRRLISSLIVLLIVISFIFFFIRLSPGDPAMRYLSPNLSPELAEEIRQSFELEKPLLAQYSAFVRNFLTGDLGISYNFKMPVTDVVLLFLPFTIMLSVVTFTVQLIVSFILAFIAVKKKGKHVDKSISKILMVIYATPSFVMGLILIFVFSFKLNMLPSSGLHSFDFDDYNFFEKLNDYFIHLILPVITLSLTLIPIYYKYLRDNLDNLFDSSFVLNLRSHGLTENKILLKHIIPNSINPLIAVAGIDLGILLSGTLIAEVMFGLPGMGRLTMNAIFSRDFPLIIGCCFSAAFLMILSNFIADTIRMIIDKRLIRGLTN